MKNASFAFRIGRVLVALIAAPLVATIAYTLVAYGAKLFFPFVYFVAGAAFTLTLLLFVPVYLLLLAKAWTSLPVVVGAAFLVTLVVFTIGFFAMDQGFTTMRAGGEDLVVQGRLTVAGFLNVVKGALIVSATGALGGLVFWLIAHAGAKGHANN